MTHGSSQALERKPREQLGTEWRLVELWGSKDLVSQKSHSGSVQILEGKGMYKETQVKSLSRV